MNTLIVLVILGQCPGGVCRPQTTAAPVLYMDSWRSQAGAAVSIQAPQAQPIFVRRGLFGRRFYTFRGHATQPVPTFGGMSSPACVGGLCR